MESCMQLHKHILKVLEYHILSVLKDRKLYGCQVIKKLEQYGISQSSLYRITAAGAASIEYG